MDHRPALEEVRIDALRGLFKKANPEELHTLHGVLSNDQKNSKQEIIEILHEEIESRSQSIFSSPMWH